MIYVRWLVSHLALPPLRMQFTGDNPLLRETLLLQQSDQQSLGSLGVATELHDLVENYPSWSTARQSQCFRPPIVTTTSSRCQISFRDGAFLRNCFA